MITREDLDQAIRECQAEREPNSNTCIKLASFYIIRDYMYPDDKSYSYAAPDVSRETVVHINSDTEFSEVIDGMDNDSAWALMDELMTALKAINKRLYDGVIQRIKNT